MLEAKGPIRAPFCQCAAVCLCAERATGPFSVCVSNSHSVHALTHMLPLSYLCQFSLQSVYFSATFFLFFSAVCLSVPLLLWPSLLPLLLWPGALCKAIRKGLLDMPVCAFMPLSIHFSHFPFFSVTCSHNCCCLRRTESHTAWLRGDKNN